MKAIWKFSLRHDVDVQTLRLPRASKPLASGWDGEALVLWAVVDPDEAPFGADVEVLVVGTGRSITGDFDQYHYLATSRRQDGLTAHVFWRWA